MNTYRIDLVNGPAFYVQATDIVEAMKKGVNHQVKEGYETPENTICAVTEVGLAV